MAGRPVLPRRGLPARTHRVLDGHQLLPPGSGRAPHSLVVGPIVGVQHGVLHLCRGHREGHTVKLTSLTDPPTDPRGLSGAEQRPAGLLLLLLPGDRDPWSRAFAPRVLVTGAPVLQRWGPPPKNNRWCHPRPWGSCRVNQLLSYGGRRARPKCPPASADLETHGGEGNARVGLGRQPGAASCRGSTHTDAPGLPADPSSMFWKAQTVGLQVRTKYPGLTRPLGDDRREELCLHAVPPPPDLLPSA